MGLYAYHGCQASAGLGACPRQTGALRHAEVCVSHASIRHPERVRTEFHAASIVVLPLAVRSSLFQLRIDKIMNAQVPSTPRSQRVVAHVAEAGSRLSRNHSGLLASLGIAAFLLVSAPALAQILGTASNFAVLGATPNVTNTGASIVTGNVGVWPAASITGFPPGLIAPGTGFLHFGDAIAQQAQSDTTAAYLVLAGLVSAPILPALGGQTLTPGVYNAGAANLTGTLTLNGPGLYVFQTTSLTTASGPGASIVSLINGATPCDVWWQVGSSAAIGTFSAVQGNILALTSITIATSASLQGRALARNGTVTLDTNAITACSGGTAPGFVVPPPAAIPPITNIPTLSEWAMVMLAALLAIAGVAAMRRQAT
jgi:Ice-binding-like/IPTL-CTERM motif